MIKFTTHLATAASLTITGIASFNQGKSGSILSVERMDSFQYRQLYGELCCLQKL